MRLPTTLTSRRGSTGYKLALGWLGLLLAVALLAPWLPLPYAPATPDLLHPAAPPAWVGLAPHYLGTDPLGRDVLAELVQGTRQLVLLTLPATLLALALGALGGGAAGYWGNHRLRLPWMVAPLLAAAAWWLLALPQLAAALVVAVLAAAALACRNRGRSWPLPLASALRGLLALLGAVPRLVLLLALAAGPPLPLWAQVLLLATLAWPEAARLTYAHMLRTRELPFVEATRMAGLPPLRSWWRHALPYAARPLLALGPLLLAGLVGLESTLSFLGVGAAVSGWGQLLATVRLEPTAWWLLAAPGLALALTLLALHRVAAHATTSASLNR